MEITGYGSYWHDFHGLSWLREMVLTGYCFHDDFGLLLSYQCQRAQHYSFLHLLNRLVTVLSLLALHGLAPLGGDLEYQA